MKYRDFKNCQTTVSVACLANDLVSPKFLARKRLIRTGKYSRK